MRTTRIRDVWVGACLVWGGLLLLASTDAETDNVLWAIFGVACAAMIVWSLLRRRLFSRPAWIFIAVGMLVSTAGLMLWNLDATASPIAPEDLLRDGAFLGGAAIALAAGMIILSLHRSSASESTGWLDSMIVLVTLVMVASEFVIYPLWFDSQLDATQSLALVFSIGLCLVLATATARVWFVSDGTVNRSLRLLAAGTLVMLAGATVTVAQDLGTSPIGSSQDHLHLEGAAFWVFFTLVGAAAADPTAMRPPVGDVDTGLTRRGRAMVLLTATVLVPPVLLVAYRGDSHYRGSAAFVGEAAVLAVLLGLRINFLILRYRDTVRREQVLREVNSALMRVTRTEEITRGISDWSARLVEQRDVDCMIGTETELAAAGIGGFGVRVRTGEGKSRYRTSIAVPGSRPPRRIIVDTAEPIPVSTLASLSVLGQSVGMALERLSLSRRIVERATAQRLEVLLHNASDVIALVDDSGTIRYMTEAIRDLTGHGPTKYVGTQWAALFDDPAFARALLDRARVAGEKAGELAITAPDDDSDAKSCHLDVNVAWLDEDEQFVVTHHDVTERYALQRELTYQAFHDELTGLMNRAVFRDQLERAAARSRRSGQPFAVLMIDLDDFKAINDSLGHPFGDEVLRVVASRLVDCMREGDTPVRLGGDEFAAILESTSSPEAATSVAQRVLQRLSEPAMVADTDVALRASIGIAMSDRHVSPEDMERDADIALYDAKFAGKGRVSVFTPNMHDMAVTRLSLTRELRRAIERDEIIVRYQPIIDMRSEAIAGAEALVRWIHPTRGELLPEAFIPYAEESGDIIPIGNFVIQHAIADLASWHHDFPEHADLRVSVNLSGRQLQDASVAETFSESLAREGVDASLVLAEVTETVLLPDDSRAASQLRRLEDQGISVYIDDFGTGWSSLQYLRSLPVSGLKLAGDFVANLPGSQDVPLLRSIHQMSAAMELEEPIAEGVETREQRDALVSIGFRLAQGFLLAKPAMAAEFRKTLSKSKSAHWRKGQPLGVPEALSKHSDRAT